MRSLPWSHRSEASPLSSDGRNYSSLERNDNETAELVNIVGKAPEGGKKETSQQEHVKSPFFAPSTPRRVRPVSTPGGTIKMKKTVEIPKENKSSLFGAYANLVMVIVGAGIVGMPYAIKEAGLVVGTATIIFVAAITDKSLRLLIETGKHIDVPSYETLFEAAFGRAGFVFISINMFIMAFGGMVSYLIIIKDTIPSLLGVEEHDVPMKRAILTVSSFVIILPLSMQRDMADLAKTSSISVVFDSIMVLIIALYAPIPEAIKASGGLAEVIANSTFNPSTFFIGLGVLSFAFVCQDSSFIIAGSLKHPTKERWAKVTGSALFTCGTLATVCGLSGFLAFQENTDGNILNNFDDPRTARAANVARGLLGVTMYFVYPLASYVARHVCIVLLFRGRRAHEGDDHTVLARRDRRIATTCALYIIALITALLFENLGVVLAVAGAVGGSCLSYIGPGSAYLGVHGGEFLVLVKKIWGDCSRYLWHFPGIPQQVSSRKSSDKLNRIEEGDDDIGMPISDDPEPTRGESETSHVKVTVCVFAWYLLCMPLWCAIASTGQRMVCIHEEDKATKSPRPNRLGKVIHHKSRRPANSREKKSLPQAIREKQQLCPENKSSNPAVTDTPEHPIRHSISDPSLDDFRAPKLLPPLNRQTFSPSQYGASETGSAGNKAISLNIATQARVDSSGSLKSEGEEGEDDPQEAFPTCYDFVVAVCFIILGLVAVTAGLVSIFMS